MILLMQMASLSVRISRRLVDGKMISTRQLFVHLWRKYVDLKEHLRSENCCFGCAVFESKVLGKCKSFVTDVMQKTRFIFVLVIILGIELRSL